ncbi:retrovirus-related pol polyprotein from transposon TNT 1-94 [Tanacetum coccineum]
MAAVNDVPQLVDKKGGNCAVIATILEPTPDERRVVLQDQRLKSIIMSCLPDDIMESVISYVLAKETWTDLVHSFDGPSNTKENRIIDLKLKYQTFRAKSIESLSQTYTRYKTLLNELANDGVNLFKHEINDNLIQRRYSDTKKALITTSSSTIISTAFFSNNVIQDFQENYDEEVDERSSEEYLRDLDIEYHERALLANSKCFIKRRNNFSGQKANENTECYKCGNKGHFARDYFSKMSEPSYKSPVNNYSSVSKGFQSKFTPKLTQSSPNSSSQADPKIQKNYKAEYKKMKAKLALLEASPLSSQNPKTFQLKNKCLVAETFDWDEEEVSNDEEVTRVKVLMALVDAELTVRKSHARNGKYVAHPTPEPVKKELGKITINLSYLDKTPVLKNSFPVAWRILFTFVIQIDIGGDHLQQSRYKILVSTAILSDLNFTKDPSKVTDIELMAHMIAVNNQRDSMSPLPLSAKPKKRKSQTLTKTSPKLQGPEASESLSKKRK